MMCCQMLRGSSFPEHKKSTGKRFVKLIILESKVVHFWNHKAEAFDQYKGLIILRAFRVPEAGSARNTGVHFVKAHFGRKPMIWGDRCFLISGDVSKHKTGGSNCESIGHKSTDCGNSDFSFNPGFLWRAVTSTSTNPSPWKDMLFVMKSCFTKHIHEFVFVRIRRTTTTISEERHRHTAENPLEQDQFGTNSHSLELGRHKQSVVETWFGRKSYSTCWILFGTKKSRFTNVSNHFSYFFRLPIYCPPPACQVQRCLRRKGKIQVVVGRKPKLRSSYRGYRRMQWEWNTWRSLMNGCHFGCDG